MKQQIIAVLLTLLLLIFLSDCTNGKINRRKVFYINSYHQGYGASDEVMQGIKDVLLDKEVVLEVFFMNTKHSSSSDSMQQKVKEALVRIDAFRPRVIIASDDNAVQHLIVPHFKESSTPVVFCGVNWTAEPYGLPAENITGMIEVLPVKATIDTIKSYYPHIRKLLVLSENTTTEMKNAQALDSIYKSKGLTVEYALVDDIDSWKENFIRGNRDFDLVYIPTNGAIKGWEVAHVRQFVGDYIRKPVITCDDFMMTYAVFGLTKVDREQGEWAAQTALRILKGADPSNIPLTHNTQTQAWINADLAEKIDFEPRPGLLKVSKIVR